MSLIILVKGKINKILKDNKIGGLEILIYALFKYSTLNKKVCILHFNDLKIVRLSLKN